MFGHCYFSVLWLPVCISPMGLPSTVSPLLQEFGLAFDLGFYISGFLLPCSLVSKHRSPGTNPT